MSVWFTYSANPITTSIGQMISFQTQQLNNDDDEEEDEDAADQFGKLGGNKANDGSYTPHEFHTSLPPPLPSREVSIIGSKGSGN